MSYNVPVASSASKITLPSGSALYINTNKLSEHNRSPISISYDKIEKSQRMADGTMRKFFIANKKQISVSWSMLPSYSTMTLDTGFGALDLRHLYETLGSSAFPVTLYYSPTRTESFTMFFSSFSCTLEKRNVKSRSTDAAQEFWEVSLTLEEQ